MTAGDPRGTQAWRRLRDQVVAEEPVCWLKLQGCTHWSTTADHVLPIAQRPDLAMARHNLRGACLSCNRRRRDKPAASAGSCEALEFFE